MTPDINFHGIRSFEAQSRTNHADPNRSNSWLTVKCIGDDPDEILEVTFFIEADAGHLLAGRIAKAINEAQDAHDKERRNEDK